MLLEPFEAPFDLPASAIALGDGQRRQGEVVGQEDHRPVGDGIPIAAAPQRVGIIVFGLQAGHHDGLVEAQAGGFVHGPGDEASPALMQPMPAGEVEIAAIHDVGRAGFPDELVEDVDIMHTASGDTDDSGKVALAGKPGVEFDGGFAFPKRGPRKERKAEVNGGGVQHIRRRLEFKAERFIGLERGGLLDEHLREIGKAAPVPLFVGHRQRVTGGGLPDASVIELRAEGRQTGFDVAQTFAPGQFGEDGATFVHKVKNR